MASARCPSKSTPLPYSWAYLDADFTREHSLVHGYEKWEKLILLRSVTWTSWTTEDTTNRSQGPSITSWSTVELRKHGWASFVLLSLGGTLVYSMMKYKNFQKLTTLLLLHKTSATLRDLTRSISQLRSRPGTIQDTWSADRLWTKVLLKCSGCHL